MVKVISTILPVFLMVCFGFAAHKFDWISHSTRQGGYDLIIQFFFPFLIFNLLAKADLNAHSAAFAGYVLAANLILYVLALFLVPRITGLKEKFIPFLMCVNEGGNIALPLVLTLFPHTSITVVFDLGVIAFNFLCVPLIITKLNDHSANQKNLLKTIVSNPFILAAAAGLFMNLTGLYNWISSSDWADAYNSIMNLLTAPIIPVILFCLGFDMSHTVLNKSILQLGLLRFILQGLVIAGFYVLFSAQMQQPDFWGPVWIYFCSPTSFGLLPMLQPLFKDQEDQSFAFSFTSSYIDVTLIVYIVVAVLTI